MNRSQLVLFLLLTSLMVVVAPTVAQPTTTINSIESGTSGRSRTRPANGVMFIENVGQFDERARFQAWGGRTVMWLADEAIWLTLIEPEATSVDALASDHITSEEERDAKSPRVVNIRLSFEGANPRAQLEASGRMTTTVSYFREKKPEQWRENVPVWESIRYIDLYPGLDLEIDGKRAPKVICRIDCESALQGITLRVDGARALRLEEGFLHITTAIGNYSLPLLTIVTTEEKASVNSLPAPRLHNNVLSFPFTTPEHSSILESTEIVEENPGNLLYSTFLGGNGWDTVRDVTIDEAGSAYITGESASLDFPTTPGVFETSQNGDFDAFIVKISPEGNALSYATFLGGESGDYGSGISVDEVGNAYVTGNTNSLDFPTTVDAFDTTHNGMSDIYVVKVNQNGSALVYSTLLGGNENEYGIDLTIDGAGRAYVTGETRSENYPTTAGAFDTTYNGGSFGGDAFAARIDNSGSILDYSTYIGGGEWDIGYGIALDNSGSVYIAGWTWSGDFPVTSGAVDTILGGGEDAFVTKLAPNGDALTYATFLGGSGPDGGADVAVDDLGNAHITGWTSSDNFPTTPDALDTSYDNGDAFMATLDSSGSFLAYATLLGGSGDDSGVSIDIDGADNVYVAGGTQSEDFPTTSGALQRNYNGNGDAFLVNLDVAGSDLSYGTYLGGDSADGGGNIVIDEAGFVFIAGGTQSGNFPTTSGTFDDSYNGDWDGYVAKLTVGGDDSETFSVDGRITDTNNSPIAGITVSTHTGHSAFTDANGDYTISGLSTGTHTIAPASEDYAFSPASRTVIVPPSVSGQNFTGSAATVQLPDYIVTGIEVTQGIQDLDNTVPLVAQKRTYVRVHVRNDGAPSAASVTARLCGAVTCLAPNNSGERINILAEPDRGEIDQSFFFELPGEWLSGSLPLTAEVNPPGNGQVAERDATNNVLSLPQPISFNWTPPVQVMLYGVQYRTRSGVSWQIHEPRQVDYDLILSWIRRAYPTASVSFSWFRNVIDLGTGVPTCEDVNQRLITLSSFDRIEGHIGPHVRYYGIVPDSGGFDDVGCAISIPGPVASGPAGTPVGNFSWDTDASYGDWYAGHELGHTYGAYHPGHPVSNVCYQAQARDQRHPPDGDYPDGKISPDDGSMYGFDIESTAIYGPFDWHDVMTYCENIWISGFTYQQIYESLASQQELPASTVDSSTGEALLIAGRINHTSGTGELDTLYRMPDAIIPGPAISGTHSIRLLDATNDILAEHPFTPGKDTDTHDAEDVLGVFGEIVLWAAGTERIALYASSSQLDAIEVSAHAPAVELTSPNGGEVFTETAVITWNASDADLDMLSHVVQYSPDGGSAWQTVGTGITNTTVYTMNLSLLPGSDEALVRVIASDGVNTTMDVSDSPFQVADKGPRAQIHGPASGQAYTSNQTIILVGEGTDVEDGMLPDTALSWHSNIAGKLGTGDMLTVSGLPIGVHTITLTATDNDNRTGSATVQVIVGYHLHLPVIHQR